MIYYPVEKRFGNEIYDIREFIQKDSLAVLSVLEFIDYTSIQTFIESSWAWVITNIKYPYITSSIVDVFDRHYMEAYIKSNSIGKKLSNAFITGALTGITRKIVTGSPIGGISNLMKDILIGNGLYSLVTSFLYNGVDLKPERTYEQFDFWNFPSETLRDMIGDCEDTSILLCSMLRNVLSENNVFVSIGFFGSTGHAWVTIINDDGTPLVLETTSEDVFTVSQNVVEQLPYKPILRFNDKIVIELEEFEEIPIRNTSKLNLIKKNNALSNFYVLK